MASRFSVPIAAVIGVLLVLSCVPAKAEKALRLRSVDLSIRTAGGAEVPVRAEIAENDEDRARGLMFRDSLPEGEGMLFIFDRDQMLSFWMKNTLIDLSIAYMSSSGKLLEIHDMEKGNLSPVPSARSARYALEVPRGWFTRAGVAVGDTLILEPLHRDSGAK